MFVQPNQNLPFTQYWIIYVFGHCSFSKVFLQLHHINFLHHEIELVSHQGKIMYFICFLLGGDEALSEELNKIPKDTVTLAAFFDGFRPNRKAGHMYLMMEFYYIKFTFIIIV